MYQEWVWTSLTAAVAVAVGAGGGGGQLGRGDIVAVTELEFLRLEADQGDERVTRTVPYPGGDGSMVHVHADVQLTERGLLLV